MVPADNEICYNCFRDGCGYGGFLIGWCL